MRNCGNASRAAFLAIASRQNRALEKLAVSVRMPVNWQVSASSEAAFDLLGHEILAEKAAALGRAAQKAEASLAKLRDSQANQDERVLLVKHAADAVYAYFIQRELCGFRKHDAVIRDYQIPKEVLVRLGAK